MARARKPQPTLDSIFFSTPEQKVIRFLLSEPTTTFTPRVISSRLKGIRGLGGTEGILRILKDLEALGLVSFCDNQRSVRLEDDTPVIKVLKTFAAMCDLEGLKLLLEPVSAKGILYGARASGESHSDSAYDLCVVSDQPEEVRKISSRHPLSKKLELVTVDPGRDSISWENENPGLTRKLESGVVVWGKTY
jgi:hypothetical protein